MPNKIKVGDKAKVGALEIEVRSIYMGSTGKMVSSEYGDFAIGLVTPVKKYYKPSNGSEGSAFTKRFCDRCKKMNPDSEKDPQCWDIFYQSLISDRVEEWIYNEEGHPICTAFEYWDWAAGDPPKSEVEDPDQLKLF
jgi:hypothetical protein